MNVSQGVPLCPLSHCAHCATVPTVTLCHCAIVPTTTALASFLPHLGAAAAAPPVSTQTFTNTQFAPLFHFDYVLIRYFQSSTTMIQ